MSNLPFLGKVIEKAIALQLQAALDDTHFLDPFQTSFTAGYRVDTAMVTLVDDLCLNTGRGSVSLLVLLDRSATCNTVDHGILWNSYSSEGNRNTLTDHTFSQRSWKISYLLKGLDIPCSGQDLSLPKAFKSYHQLTIGNTRETWQRNPSAKYVFCSVLQQVTRPWLSQHLEKVLPPALLLSDDYRVENKILGVQCLHHIIRNVPAADLCQFNRAQVVNHALSLHLYSKEAQLMQILLPCILDLLPILEKASLQQSHNPPLVTPSNEVFQLVLTHMEAEPQLSLRRIYARSLPTFVERFGIQITQHLKRLLQVIVGYLEIADGPEEVARLAILDTLKCTIQHAWPRMIFHLNVLLKALLKMMWDVSTDNSFTPEPVKAELLQKATECLLLLDHSTHGQVKILLQGVHQHCQNAHLKKYLKKVQMEPGEVWSPGELNNNV